MRFGVCISYRGAYTLTVVANYPPGKQWPISLGYIVSMRCLGAEWPVNLGYLALQADLNYTNTQNHTYGFYVRNPIDPALFFLPWTLRATVGVPEPGLPLLIYVYICIYVCTNTYILYSTIQYMIHNIYIYTYICVYIYIHMCIYIYIYMYTCVCIWLPSTF